MIEARIVCCCFSIHFDASLIDSIHGCFKYVEIELFTWYANCRLSILIFLDLIQVFGFVLSICLNSNHSLPMMIIGYL